MSFLQLIPLLLVTIHDVGADTGSALSDGGSMSGIVQVQQLINQESLLRLTLDKQLQDLRSTVLGLQSKLEQLEQRCQTQIPQKMSSFEIDLRSFKSKMSNVTETINDKVSLSLKVLNELRHNLSVNEYELDMLQRYHSIQNEMYRQLNNSYESLMRETNRKFSEVDNDILELRTNISFRACPQPTVPPNASVLSGSNNVGATRVIECKPGYAQSGGENGIECQPDLTWSSWLGTCITCSDPPSIQHGIIVTGDNMVGSQRNYSCTAGYSGNGMASNITCQDDATWSMTSFSCSIIDCGLPPTLHSATSYSTTTTWNSTATYTCNFGYIQSGIMDILCLTSGNWSSFQFTCMAPLTATFDFEGTDEISMVDGGGDWEWETTSGPTLSSDTGPASAYHGLWYSFLEGTYGDLGDNVRMVTEIHLNANAQCLDFYYNMYGVDIGTLYVKYQEQGSLTEQLLWSESGNKGNDTWFNARLQLNMANDFKLIFEGTRGQSYYGDIAVDYIRVLNSSCTDV